MSGRVDLILKNLKMCMYEVLNKNLKNKTEKKLHSIEPSALSSAGLH